MTYMPIKLAHPYVYKNLEIENMLKAMTFIQNFCLFSTRTSFFCANGSQNPADSGSLQVFVASKPVLPNVIRARAT